MVIILKVLNLGTVCLLPDTTIKQINFEQAEVKQKKILLPKDGSNMENVVDL